MTNFTAILFGLSCVLSAGMSAAIPSPTAAAQKDLAVTGRLSCTTEETREAPQGAADDLTARPISCTYQPSTGQPAKFKGAIGRSGGQPAEGAMSEKRVLVWLVHGPAAVSPDDLAGVYTRTSPPRLPVEKGFENALISANGAIALIPPAGSDQLPGNSAVTILELTLSAVRV